MTEELKNFLTIAEVTKIYNEIHQLRNHQFFITLAAITFLGVAIGVSFNNLPDVNCQNSPNIPIGYFRFGVIIALHTILAILFYFIGLAV
jgi:hypothetical protein